MRIKNVCYVFFFEVVKMGHDISFEKKALAELITTKKKMIKARLREKLPSSFFYFFRPSCNRHVFLCFHSQL